jgi:small-conductance mechanosensitive channel
MRRGMWRRRDNLYANQVSVPAAKIKMSSVTSLRWTHCVVMTTVVRHNLCGFMIYNITLFIVLKVFLLLKYNIKQSNHSSKITHILPKWLACLGGISEMFLLLFLGINFFDYQKACIYTIRTQMTINLI